jgi:hypothetical protein
MLARRPTKVAAIEAEIEISHPSKGEMSALGQKRTSAASFDYFVGSQ